MKIKQAIITGFMGKLRDRFCEYHADRTPEGKIAAVARVKGAKGVEIVYPYECRDLSRVKRTLDKYGLVFENCTLETFEYLLLWKSMGQVVLWMKWNMNNESDRTGVSKKGIS